MNSKTKVAIVTAILTYAITSTAQGILADTRYEYDVNKDGIVNVMDLNCLKTYLFKADKEEPEVTTTPTVITEPLFSTKPVEVVESDLDLSKYLLKSSILQEDSDYDRVTVGYDLDRVDEITKDVKDYLVNTLGMSKDIDIEIYYGGKAEVSGLSEIRFNLKDKADWEVRKNGETQTTVLSPSCSLYKDVEKIYRLLWGNGYDEYMETSELYAYADNMFSITDTSTIADITLFLKDDKVISGGVNGYGVHHELGRYLKATYGGVSLKPVYDKLVDESFAHYEFLSQYVYDSCGNLVETDTEYIIPVYVEYIESFSTDFRKFGNLEITEKDCLLIHLNKSTEKVSYSSIPCSFNNISNIEAEKIVRDFLNENIDESAFCTIMTGNSTGFNSSIVYSTEFNIPQNEYNIGYDTVKRVYVKVESSNVDMLTGIYNRFAEKCGYPTVKENYSKEFFVYLYKDDIVGFTNSSSNYYNYNVYNAVKANNPKIVKALEEYFGDDLYARITLLETLSSLGTYNTSNNKVSWNITDGKFNTTDLGNDLVSFSLGIKELKPLNKDGKEVLLADGTPLLTGNIKFVVNTKTQTVERAIK